MNIKEIISCCFSIPLALSKRFIRSMLEPQMLLMYGIMLRLAVYLVFSIMLNGRTPDTMSAEQAYKVLLNMMIVFDVYTVLVMTIRYFMECKKEGIRFVLNPSS